MNREQLSDALGGIDDRFVAEAYRYDPEAAGASERKKRMKPKRFVSLALAAALSGLIDRMRGGWGKGAMLTALALAALAGLLGLRRTVAVGFPAVGWLCAVLMLALACRADALLFRGVKG